MSASVIVNKRSRVRLNVDLNSELKEILLPAYGPCEGFSSTCGNMRWSPSEGHVPRGFLGAHGRLNEVELVLVFAEPGDPHDDEFHSGIGSAYEKAMRAFSEGTDLFHKNVRLILDLCWPKMTFEEQMKKTWMTESVLCSAPVESGHVGAACERNCASRYLAPQIELLNRCVIAALGSKARDRMRAIGIKSFIPAVAAAPPGCNLKHARASWQAIADEIHRRNGIGQPKKIKTFQTPDTTGEKVVGSARWPISLIGGERA